MVEDFIKEAKGTKITIKHIYRDLNQVTNYSSELGPERGSNGSVILERYKKLRAMLLGG